MDIPPVTSRGKNENLLGLLVMDLDPILPLFTVISDNLLNFLKSLFSCSFFCDYIYLYSEDYEMLNAKLPSTHLIQINVIFFTFH